MSTTPEDREITRITPEAPLRTTTNRYNPIANTDSTDSSDEEGMDFRGNSLARRIINNNNTNARDSSTDTDISAVDSSSSSSDESIVSTKTIYCKMATSNPSMTMTGEKPEKALKNAMENVSPGSTKPIKRKPNYAEVTKLRETMGTALMSFSCPTKDLGYSWLVDSLNDHRARMGDETAIPTLSLIHI